MAFEFGLTALFANVEAAFHRLAVAGAVGVRAAEHFGDFFGQGEPAFVDDFEVFDGVDDGFGGEEGEAVGGVVVQPDAGDFDDVFAALGFAGQVEADGDGAAVVQQFELAQDNQAFACGDVVDDGAFFDGFDTEFGGFHICSLYFFVQHQRQNRHAGVNAVGCLLEIVGVRRGIDVGVDFINARQGVQHAQVGAGVGEHGGVEVEFALDFGELLFVEAFALDAGHVQDVRPFDGGFEVGQDLVAAACGFEFFGDVFGHGEAGRGDEGEFAVPAFEGLAEGVDGAAVFEVTRHGDFELVQTALGFINGNEVEQGLAGVLVGAVAGVDDGDFGKLGGHARGAVFGVALDDGVGVAGDDAGGVGEGFAFFRAGVRAVGEADDFAAQALYGGFKRQARAGGGFEKA